MSSRYPIADFQKSIGLENKLEIERLMHVYPGISNRELSRAMGIGQHAIGRHVKQIRNDWYATFNRDYPKGDE